MRLKHLATVLWVLNAAAVFAAPPTAAPDSTIAGERADDADPWLGQDKIDHLTASAFLLGTQYYMLRGELEQSHEQSLRLAVTGTLALGVAKEIYDGVSKKGTPSWKDLVADALGIVLAAAWLRQ